MKKCPYCNKELIGTNAGQHLKGHKNGKSSKEKKFDYIVFNNKDFFNTCKSKKDFEELYKNNSLPDFLKKWPNLGGTKGILFLVEWYGIKRRTSSEAAKKFVIPKNKEYYKKNFGTTNSLSKGSPGYEKKNRTIKEKYGVNNIFQEESIKKWIFSDELYLEKYNLTRKELFSKSAKKWVSSLTAEEKINWLNKSILNKEIIRKRSGIQSSSLEKKIAKLCIDIGFLIETQFFQKYDKKRYLYDIRIKNTNILIEVQGTMWHCDPRFYKETDIIFIGNTAKEIWEKDAKRKEITEKNGWKLIYLWEYDIKNLSDQDLIYKIKQEIQNVI